VKYHTHVQPSTTNTQPQASDIPSSDTLSNHAQPSTDQTTHYCPDNNTNNKSSPLPPAIAANHSPQTSVARQFWRPEAHHHGAQPTPSASSTRNFHFTHLASTHTLIPGSQDHFDNFGLGLPAIFEQKIVFFGVGYLEQSGIYLADTAPADPLTQTQLTPARLGSNRSLLDESANSPAIDAVQLRTVVNSLSTVPWSQHHFAYFGSCPILDQGRVIFLSQDESAQLRLYKETHRLIPLIGTDTPFNTRGDSLTNLSNPTACKGQLAFLGRQSQTGQKIIFKYTNGGIQAIARQASPATAKTVCFRDLAMPDIDEQGQVVFRAQDTTGQAGIYGLMRNSPQNSQDTHLTAFVSTQTPIPTGIGNFTSFSDPLIDQSCVTFVGKGSVSQEGIYRVYDHQLITLANTQTRLPDSLETFAHFQSIAVDGQDVAFLARDASCHRLGIFFAHQNTIIKVIEIGDLLDHKPIKHLFLGRHGLHQRSLAFKAVFIDGTEGIFRADLK
jgi:hypothetical protein